MNLRYLLLAFGGVLASAAVGADAPPPDNSLPYTFPRVVFPHVTINGQPARLTFDSGSTTAILWDTAARRLGVKTVLPDDKSRLALSNIHSAISEPIRMELGQHAFTAPLPVMGWDQGIKLDGDGVLGWFEIKSNILAFDPAQRTVSSVAKLPPETATWLKLKTYRLSILALELPLPNGKTGVMLIDTGAENGVILSPLLWHAFKQSHPQATITTTGYFMAGERVTREQSWTNEIALGPLTLVDVPVSEASASDISGLDDYVCTLGLAALARLNLVVDARGGYAYLRSLPATPTPSPSGKPAAPDLTQDWTMEGDFQIRTDHLYYYAGAAKENQGDLDGALADFNHTLELNPMLADAYVERGKTKLKQGHPDDAIADFNHALEIDPKNADALANRAEADKARTNAHPDASTKK